MKEYKEFITEISAFRQQFRETEIRYPGVYQFMTVAARYLNRPEKLKDRKLVRLLKRLKRRSDIQDFTKADLMRVYKFIELNNLQEIEAIRTFFFNAKNGIPNNTVDTGIDDDDDMEDDRFEEGPEE